eukprot:CAMPEP_0170496536 /NCGR_PEP_ID=MMETSP0208-20121228/21974_1 /TAXON_ID=197538 /ORGANISM="Strombidium inclinatum, Strain S3" /LENGTH=87 /DNA_ID=CAMNT_0010773107 /DNA_START=264 /DNA_END=524 /DNA_ORIENTATION=-
MTISESIWGTGKNYISYIPLLFEMQYEIISTDYDNYAVAYGCTNYFSFLWHFDTGTLMSRTPHLAERYVREAKHALKRVGFNYNANW